MNLIVDVGNTLIKLAVFNSNELIYKDSFERHLLLERISELNNTLPNISHCIISAVGRTTETQLEFLQKKYKVISLTHDTKVPFLNEYATQETLGVDRIALVSAAAVDYPERDVLVIDAGSCITYDFLSAENTYSGGAISPGLEMRYKAVHHFTDKLPLLKPQNSVSLVGDSTLNAIHSGVFNGMVYELDGFISSYKEKYPDLTVILTGGDAHLLRVSLKNDIFANSNFLLEGLHYILELNKD